MNSDHRIAVHLPENVRCAIALSYDTDMAGGYAPDGVCHGRTMPALKDYMLRLCDTAEAYEIRLQFFQIGNGLEPSEDVGYLQEILRRGHNMDSHTYSHVPLDTDDLELLTDELQRTNRLFEQRLGHTSTVLRGPGGYAGGLQGMAENQQCILDAGFRWVSCEYNFRTSGMDIARIVSGPADNAPYAYETGLVELPIMSVTDRNFFDIIHCIDAEVYAEWRKTSGHQPVPNGFRCPWTDPGALDEWIAYNLAVAEYAYENELMWVACWHPYSHYLHDPDNRTLPALLEWADNRPDVLVCTVRDACEMLSNP